MIIGYARVSTQDQNLDAQLDALREAGCKRIYQEKISGASKERPELKRMLEELEPGDEVLVWKLDRLGRSLSDLIQIVNDFQEKSIGFRCLQDAFVDTTTPQGRLVFSIFGALAEFERNIIRERTKAGLAAARARGRQGGRPKGLSKDAQNTATAAETLYRKGEMSVDQICRQLRISKSTLYRYLRLQGVHINSESKEK